MAERLEYPNTHKGDVVDHYHGVAVSDPYRWLETPVKLGGQNVDAKTARASRDVAAWVAAQNRVTEAFLAGIPQREAIRKRLEALWNFERYSAPTRAGGRYYFSKNDGLANQNVVYVQDSLDAKPLVFFDPNKLSDDGTVALAGLTFSEDGRYAAYGLASAGSDWSEWRVREIATGKDLPEVLRWVKFSGAAWLPDGSGFFYSRYDEPSPGEEFQGTNLDQRLVFHRVGTPQSADRVVYRRPDAPEWTFSPTVSDDGHHLVITISKSTDDKYRVARIDLTDPEWRAIDLVDRFENEYRFVGNDGQSFYFKTDVDAPRGRVIALDIGQPGAPLREVIPQAKDALVDVSLVGGRFFARYLEDAKTRVAVFDREGARERVLELPGIGTATGFDGRSDHHETFYSFTTFTEPASTFRYDVEKGTSALLERAEAGFDGAPYEVRQVWYKSKDGTRVPMFLVFRRGIELDGSHPTLLYGYGGFNVPLVPAFSVMRAAWLEMGGVFAMPNLRGGGEYGENWHRAGTKTHKQNVFDDFIAAAEYLVAEKYTSPGKLAIQGGSNGGLLVGAAMTQRPELFGACLPAVGVMDMLRYHLFTAGRFWVDDYGSSDVPDEFAALYAYSPYHNLEPGVHYPATLVTTADTDDRVVPGHSFKFAARLQEVQAGDDPVLIRIETSAGHGAGTPTSKLIDETVDELAFLVAALGMSPP